MNKFKIGDIIEGVQTDRWIVGRVYKVADAVLDVDVLDSDKVGGFPDTWKIMAINATLSKSYVINKILSEI